MIKCWFCQEDIEGVPEFHTIFRCQRFYCFNEKNRNYGLKIMNAEQTIQQVGHSRQDE